MPIKWVTRKELGWPPSGARVANPRSGVALHYDGSNRNLANKNHRECVAYWKWCRGFHMKTRGWADIGYSFGVCPHGFVFEGRGWNREQAAQPGGNTTYYSITLMCGPSDRIPQVQIDTVNLLIGLMKSKGVSTVIKGHSNFYNTSCPGDKIRSLMRNGVFKAVTEGDDDLAYSEKQLTEIVRRAVWDQDKCEPPWPSPHNPTWTYANVMRTAALQVSIAREESKTQTAALNARIDALESKLNSVVSLLDQIVSAVNSGR